MVRESTLRRLTARLKVVVPFAALLSAASFQAAWAQTAQPDLLTAGSFAVLGASTVTNDGATFVTGDLGVSPGTAITGFDPFPANVLVNVPPGTVSAGGGLVNGGSIHAGGVVAAQAHADAAVTYLDLQGRTCDVTHPAVAQLGDLTLPPGVHCFPTSANVTGTLILSGNADDVWIFQIGSTLVAAPSSAVVMAGGAKATNVWWAVGSSGTLETGVQFSGNILALASISLNTNAKVFGRALALNGAVTMDTNNVSTAECAGAACSPALSTRPQATRQVAALVDYYQCDLATPEGGASRQGRTINIEDEFGTPTAVTLKRPELVCAPVAVDGDFETRVRTKDANLVCYDIMGLGGSRQEVSVDNEVFDPQSLTIRNPKLVCVPSIQTSR